jgi:hypothetical protein
MCDTFRAGLMTKDGAVFFSINFAKPAETTYFYRTIFETVGITEIPLVKRQFRLKEHSSVGDLVFPGEK